MLLPDVHTHDDLLRELRRLELHARRMASAPFVGEYKSAFRGTGLEVDSLRRYEPGDDVRAIDWNTTARTGELQVKVYREEREQSLYVLLDASASQQFGTGPQRKLRYGLEVAALLGYAALHSGDRFGLVLGTNQLEAHFPARKGRAHLLNALSRTLSTTPAATGTDLVPALEHLLRTGGRHAHIVVVSDFLTPSPGLDRTLGRVAQAHHLLLVRLQHPQEALTAGQGVLPVQDAETGRQRLLFTGLSLPWRKPTATSLAQAFQVADQRLQALSKRLGCGYIRLHTHRDPVGPLQRYFAQQVRTRR
jgi:uncharacterized protein (DUF58 family)